MKRLELHIGDTIRSVRLARHLTGEQLAEKCGVNAVFLRQIENGSKYPSLSLFVEICNALEVSPDHLLRQDLPANELSEIKELDRLFRQSDIEKQLLVLRMLRAVLSED